MHRFLKEVLSRTPDQSGNTFMKVMDVIVWGMIVLLFIVIQLSPLAPSARTNLTILLVCCALFNFIYFRVLFPRFSNTTWFNLLAILFMVWIGAYFNTYFMVHNQIVVLYAILTTGIGIRYGFLPALLIALGSAAASTWVAFSHKGFELTQLVFQFIEFALYLGGGYIGSSLAAVVRAKAAEAESRTRNLSLVIDAAAIMTTLDLNQALPRLAEMIVKGLSFACCRISLYDPDSQTMVTYAAHPVRPLDEFKPGSGERHTLDEMPWHLQVIQSRRRLLVRISDLPQPSENPEQSVFFFRGLQAACLIPLVVDDQTIGVIAVGEARKWDREPITLTKIDLLETIAGNAAAMVHNAHLHQTTHKQFERMAVLNQIARDLSDTLELDDLMERTYHQLNRVIPAETYFIGLFEAEKNILDLRVVIDEGLRFPPDVAGLRENLTGWVVRQGKPLLIRSLSREIDTLPVKPDILGQEKLSESWLGVPMVAHDRVTGVLVVASYSENAFSEEDAELLGTVASQVALALENARNYAEVQEQSRRDSLTGVLNHGYFIHCLSDQVTSCEATGKPLALIMLDIDHFKQYNDTYGHTLGDQVLRITAQAIQHNIKSTDLVGRWGGEEFAIALSGASTLQAFRIAERIRTTLVSLPLQDGKGNELPKPTVSQGIATFPEHARDAGRLVDLADRMLYGAKRGGRDQVQVFDGQLEPLDSIH